MKRKIFLDQNLANNQLLKITDQEIISRIIKVYRLELGESLIFIGKDLFEGYYTLKERSKNKLIFEFQESIIRNLLPPKELFFYLSFIKKENFELILSKSFELGVKKIIPVKTERSPWISDEVSERWLKIMYKGLEIGDWNYLPEIGLPINLKDVPKNIYVLEKNGKPINEIIFPHSISLLIGPEGGFSNKELEILKNKNSQFVSLGQTNLRTETVFFICASLLNFG
jgi:16S rRNA (uracil1498-N3)-methyltransferase